MPLNTHWRESASFLAKYGQAVNTIRVLTNLPSEDIAAMYVTYVATMQATVYPATPESFALLVREMWAAGKTLDGSGIVDAVVEHFSSGG